MCRLQLLFLISRPLGGKRRDDGKFDLQRDVNAGSTATNRVFSNLQVDQYRRINYPTDRTRFGTRRAL